jgi:hypothetical protein
VRAAGNGEDQRLTALSAGDGGAALDGAGRRAGLVERGYVHASFGGLPVLVGPELAAELKAFRQSREGRS